jgi:hypothetical protein
LRELMRPPKYGGRSKRDQLGSIDESWGPLPNSHERVGLFQAPIEPPSLVPPLFKTLRLKHTILKRHRISPPGPASPHPRHLELPAASPSRWVVRPGDAIIRNI